jgi:thiol-disulfide isomerase/thioredoxin
VAVDFWATWCPECTPATKRLATVYQELHDKGLEVIGVNLDEDKAAMEAFAKKQGLTWPNFFDGKKWGNQIGRRYGINSIPTLWVFDKKGMLVSTKEPENLSAEVKRLLAEP